ncbi:16S rRNA (guanine(527)-N(7))-methyltransferase RsmG [Candidatus Gracilibacteria bacterium]|nr:MAG: 16S rRNA (guanine(527)-N(7))-methyltransferase RsmG [Candidatus Gracilibacteria bacterium]PIE84909.1 MAG: 16S rRNA (guanine(527)-N(7))-methyltransferase RsmG [Candidatus Gracilibacteria bacterium]
MLDLLDKYNIELDSREIELFKKFLDLFIEKNSQINLSAIRKVEDIIEKHFIDSIMLNVFLDLKGNVGDVGTGGGFPLIPLAITNKNVNFTGIDSVGKKLKAIDEFVLKLGLKNIVTLNGRCEELGKDLKYRETFDYVLSRATAFMPTLIEYTIPFLKVGGIFVAYKLDDKEELNSSKKALNRLGAKILKVKNYKIGEQKRTLVFIEKVSKTHKKYPRNIGEPLKNPIK